jgi:hypothetical protein
MDKVWPHNHFVILQKDWAAIFPAYAQASRQGVTSTTPLEIIQGNNYNTITTSKKYPTWPSNPKTIISKTS